MKQREAKRLTKVVDALAKVREYLAADKTKPADKKVESIMKMLTKATAGAKKKSASSTKAPSAFSLFVKQNFKKVKAAHPDWTAPQVMKYCSKLYRGEASAPSSPKKKSASPAKKATKPRKPRAKKAAS